MIVENAKNVDEHIQHLYLKKVHMVGVVGVPNDAMKEVGRQVWIFMM